MGQSELVSVHLGSCAATFDFPFHSLTQLEDITVDEQDPWEGLGLKDETLTAKVVSHLAERVAPAITMLIPDRAGDLQRRARGEIRRRA